MEQKYSDDDVNRIIARKYANWQKKQVQLIYENQKLTKMTETQKLQCEKLTRELEHLQKKQAVMDFLIDIIRKGVVC